MAKRIVIWGLKSSRHSRRYIHQGFYSSFRRLGYDTVWVDDKKSNQALLEGSNLVLAVDVASTHLQWRPNNQYVLHNLKREDFISQPNVLNLQVITRASSGLSLDESIAKYDSKSKTLFQPWGISEEISHWKSPSEKNSKTEFWIGAIWNNSLNQGNSKVMGEYVDALREREINLRRVGGTRSIRKSGVNPLKALDLVNRSPIGSAIVGQWQLENQYIPCRLFKNIAAGHVPTSNANFNYLFGDVGYFSEDISSIIDYVLSLNIKAKIESVRDAQQMILPYTYERGIRRILDVLSVNHQQSL